MQRTISSQRMICARRVRSADRAEAFTLIEVLVVVAIIALLISILLPSLSRAREQTRSVVCAANMRVILQATVIYSECSQDWMVWNVSAGGAGWENGTNTWEVLFKYIQRAKPSPFKDMGRYPLGRAHTGNWVPMQIDWYLCPSDVYYHETAVAKAEMPDGTLKDAFFPLSYSSNVGVFGKLKIKASDKFTPIKRSSIRRASDIVCYSEQGDDENIHDQGWEMQDWNYYAANITNANTRKFQLRHLSGSNVGYVDGHVQFAKFVNKGPQYGLPVFPYAIVPDYKSVAMGGIKDVTGAYDAQYDNWVRPAPKYVPD